MVLNYKSAIDYIKNKIIQLLYYLIMVGDLSLKTSCRYTGIVIGVLVLVILISGCMYGAEANLGNNTSPIKTYSAYNISFNYSSNWYAYNATTGSNNVVPGDLPLRGDVFTSNTNRSNNNDMIFVVSKDVMLQYLMFK